MIASPHVFDVTQADFEEKVLLTSTRVPVLVDFWAPWCGPCRQLTPVLEKLVTDLDGRVVLAKINTDEQMQLASIFGIKSLPTVLLMVDGRPLDGFLGVQPEAAIRQLLETHLGPLDVPAAAPEPEPEAVATPEQRVAELRARMQAEPDKSELALELAQALMQVGAVTEVKTLLDALPANLAEGDAAKVLRSHLAFAKALEGAPALDALVQRIESDPKDLRARHQLGTRFLLDGNHEAALEQFLEIMRRDRKFDEDLGRKTLIAAFDLVHDADLVSKTRRRMAALLF